MPKGTGLVEAALAAGIEIPVFCYEPRLGPPVGACRMCLVEIEPGLPKPQAACTLTAADGMVVKTARSSEQAADGAELDARVHPRQPPARLPGLRQGRRVPAPGPDLPLRARASTRMSFDKRTLEKPIPISPTIALDRERCILCYRCTRFSEAVAEDGAARRGQPRLAVDDRHLRGRALPRRRSPGNVIELCPVGALTSTQYRFEARPWEIQNVPTVCGLCPVGCNISATTARGQGQADPLPQPPRGRRGLALRQGPVRLRATSARTTGSATRCARTGVRRFEPLGWDEALDEAERLLRAAGSATVTALSGSETVEQAYGLAKLLRSGLGAHAAVLPEAIPDALDAFRAPLSSIRDARAVVVLCDEPVVERAPIVDLWIKAARRKGARDPDRAPDRADRGRRPDQRRRRDRRLARARARRRRRRSTCRARRTAAASPTPGACAADGEAPDERAEAARSSRATRRPPIPAVRALAARADARDRDRHVRGAPSRGLVRPRPARARATSSATGRPSTSRAASSASAAP